MTRLVTDQANQLAVAATPLTVDCFWQFSLEVYPTLKQPLLQLQDNYNANVNLLLLLLWLQQQQLSVNTQQLERLIQALVPINTKFTAPIRELRRQASIDQLQAAHTEGLTLSEHLADNSNRHNAPSFTNALPPLWSQLRQQLLAAELGAEQLEQQALVAAYQPLQPLIQRSPEAGNLPRYFRILLQQPALPAAVSADLDQLLQQFSALTPSF